MSKKSQRLKKQTRARSKVRVKPPFKHGRKSVSPHPSKFVANKWPR